MVRKAYKLYRLGGAISEILYSPALAGVVPPKDVVRPYGRINAMMAVQARARLLWGGGRFPPPRIFDGCGGAWLGPWPGPAHVLAGENPLKPCPNELECA